MGNNDKGDTWQSDSEKGKDVSEKEFTIGNRILLRNGVAMRERSSVLDLLE